MTSIMASPETKLAIMHQEGAVVVGDDLNEEQEEALDHFEAVTDNIPMFDPQSIRLVEENSRTRRRTTRNFLSSNAEERSLAATDLASSVGSVVIAPKDAFLKSITFLRDKPSVTLEWGIQFKDPAKAALTKSNRTKKPKSKLFVDGTMGAFALSKIKPGDYIKSINGQKWNDDNATAALIRMKGALRSEGYLCLATGNKEDRDDILIQATIIKPNPQATYEQLGMVVWHWGYLCIKSIDKDSIFRKTVLKSTDQIVSINDISCERMKPEAFAHIINELPYDITLTVLRRKERWTGFFG